MHIGILKIDVDSDLRVLDARANLRNLFNGLTRWQMLMGAGIWPINGPIGGKHMTRSELIARIAQQKQEEGLDLKQRDIERIVATIFDEISAALARGDRVELRGFGAFSVKHRDARVGRNPRTGASVEVGSKSIPFFKTGKQLRDRLNAGG